MWTQKPLALTMGDPAGIGGEIALKAWRALRDDGPVFFALDDPARLKALARKVGAPDPVEIDAPEKAAAIFAAALPVLPEKLAAPAKPGLPIEANAAPTIRAIERAVELARAGRVGGVVTNPINKKALYDGADFAFPGHTEFLAHLCEAKRSVMMLAAPELRVVPVTIHMPLAQVPAALTEAAIINTARILAADLQRWFGIAQPRIAVSGLNPHAGEGGAMGDEEIRLVIPALEVLRAEGLTITGPHPADTMFHAEARARYDAALCMYHDQALIPLKTLDFHQGVNVTLGLGIVRTSPDHGVAYDIAGQGVANPSSLIAALKMAGDMAARA